MTTTFTSGNAMVLTPAIPPHGAGARAVAVIERGSPAEAPPGFLQISATVPRSVARVIWNAAHMPYDEGVAGSTTRRPSFQKWFAKLRSLSRLQDGWDSYTASAPKRQALATAESYLSTLELLAWEPTRVEASVMGGVGITHRAGTRKVYVEFYNDGTVHALFSDRTPNMRTVPVATDLPSWYRFIGRAREYLNG